jgi:hypothetical protein
MIIHRDTTGAAVNRIWNHPEVRPWIVNGPDHELDLRPAALDPRYWLLVGEPELGSFFCVRFDAGLYEAHAAVLPEGRGEWSLEFGRSAIRAMFTGTDCIEILTRVPQGHPACLALVRNLGFSPRWTRPSCNFRGRNVPCTVWSLTMQEWFPAEDEARKAALAEMCAAGWERKAQCWQKRWALLSRERMTA